MFKIENKPPIGYNICMKNINNSSLDLSASNIEDLRFIKKYKEVSRLNLNSNQIKDISPLKEMQQLTHLDLSDNPFTDPSPSAH